MEAGSAPSARPTTSVRLSEALIASERHNLPRYESVQPEYNRKREGFESGLQSLVRAQDMGVINYYALASGFQRQVPQRRRRGRVRGRKIVDTYLNERGLRILKALDEVAEDANCTPAQARWPGRSPSPASPRPSSAPPRWNNSTNWSRPPA